MYVLYSIAWSVDFDGRCAPCVAGVYRSPELQKRQGTSYAIIPKRQNHQNLSDFTWSFPHPTSSFLSFSLQSDDE